jgi:hypothetical protein
MGSMDNRPPRREAFFPLMPRRSKPAHGPSGKASAGSGGRAALVAPDPAGGAGVPPALADGAEVPPASTGAALAAALTGALVGRGSTGVHAAASQRRTPRMAGLVVMTRSRGHPRSRHVKALSCLRALFQWRRKGSTTVFGDPTTG